MATTVELVRRFIDEAWNNGDYSVIDEIMHEPYQAVSLNAGGPPMPPQSLQQMKLHVREFREAFKDLQMRIEDSLESGERVFVQTRLTGTQDGSFMGMPPTGRKIDIVLSAVYEQREGRLAGHTVLVDMAGMLQQLGMAPPPAGGPPPQ